MASYTGELQLADDDLNAFSSIVLTRCQGKDTLKRQLILEEEIVPTLEPAQVLVKVHAVSLNVSCLTSQIKARSNLINCTVHRSIDSRRQIPVSQCNFRKFVSSYLAARFPG